MLTLLRLPFQGLRFATAGLKLDRTCYFSLRFKFMVTLLHEQRSVSGEPTPIPVGTVALGPA
jgi:hypothetical protein